MNRSKTRKARRRNNSVVVLHVSSNVPNRLCIYCVGWYVHQSKTLDTRSAYNERYNAVYFDASLLSTPLRYVIGRKCHSRVAIYILEHSLSFSQAVHKLALGGVQERACYCVNQIQNTKRHPSFEAIGKLNFRCGCQHCIPTSAWPGT